MRNRSYDFSVRHQLYSTSPSMLWSVTRAVRGNVRVAVEVASQDTVGGPIHGRPVGPDARHILSLVRVHDLGAHLDVGERPQPGGLRGPALWRLAGLRLVHLVMHHRGPLIAWGNVAELAPVRRPGQPQAIRRAHCLERSLVARG